MGKPLTGAAYLAHLLASTALSQFSALQTHPEGVSKMDTNNVVQSMLFVGQLWLKTNDSKQTTDSATGQIGHYHVSRSIQLQPLSLRDCLLPQSVHSTFKAANKCLVFI